MSSFQAIETDEHRKQLLRYIRDTAQLVLDDSPLVDHEQPSIEGAAGGAFVTFWHDRSLRGCMGSFRPTSDIPATMVEVTRSALQDPRFKSDPITAHELPELTIELSILSTAEHTSDPLGLIPGQHGIVVTRGKRSGCFLPHVASERGLTAEAFLSMCCTMKAGLPADAWKDEKTEVRLFESDSFSDADID
jgi:AmmeMemoRadiSam system protein A